MKPPNLSLQTCLAIAERAESADCNLFAVPGRTFGPWKPLTCPRGQGPPRACTISCNPIDETELRGEIRYANRGGGTVTRSFSREIRIPLNGDGSRPAIRLKGVASGSLCWVYVETE